MKTKQLPVWKDAKRRAYRLAKKSRYYDWARDIRRLKNALLVDYPPENIPKTIFLDAIDIAYKKGRPEEFRDLDENGIEQKYLVTSITTKSFARRLTEPILGVAAALIFALSFLYLRPSPFTRAEPNPLETQIAVDHNHSEPEPLAEETTQVSSSKPVVSPWIKELAESEGYFEKNGKLYLRIGDSTVWDKLWRGRFKFYPSWDETLAKVMEYNPGKHLDRLSPNTELVVIDDLNHFVIQISEQSSDYLHRSNYLVVLEGSLRK